MDKYVGKRLDGRYEIKDIIGVGGMAVVYKAYDCIDDRIVALKILKEEFVANEEFLRRFKNESKAIAVLSHPNIVKVYDVSFGDLLQYIVMEYIDGITLKEYIERQGSLRWKDAVHFSVQILRALQHAHDKGIVHRDVKPQNIMLLPDGTIKVTDFGIARFARSEHRTMTDKAIGSVHYISPEQARGDITDEKSDIYSAGVLLYEMLTGKLPFQADSAVSVAIMQLQSNPKMPREQNPSIPQGLEQITMHAMEKEPVKRYKSAAEMLRDIEEFKRDPEMVFKYTFFVDDSPTRYVDKIGTDVRIGGDDLYSKDKIGSHSAAPVTEEEEEEVEEKKTNIIPILAGIAVALVAVAIVSVVLLVNYVHSGGPGSFAMPTLVGMSWAEVSEKIANEEGDYGRITFNTEYKENPEVPEGEIFYQSLAAGRRVKDGNAKCTVHISSGKNMVQVPDLRDFDYAAATQQLKARKFGQPLRIDEHNPDVQSGCVIRTVPAAPESAPEGSQIIVYVSLGPEIEKVKVPDLTNMTKENAKIYGEKEGFVVVIGTAKDHATVPEGVICEQSPTKDRTVDKGSTITVYPSTGKPPVIIYPMTFTVDMPTDFYDPSHAEVVIMLGGKEVKREKFNPTYGKKYEFTIESTVAEGTVYVLLKGSEDSALKAAEKENYYGMKERWFPDTKFEFYLKYSVDFKNKNSVSTDDGSGRYVTKSEYEMYKSSLDHSNSDISSSPSSDSSSHG